MSLGKKKSGFQITSVTSDYEKKGALLLQGGGGGGGREEDGTPEERPRLVENGHLCSPPKRGGPPSQNGPLPPLASFAGVGSGGPGSRFRVVKLDHALGEAYRRGRWTCRDFYEQEELDQHCLARRTPLTEATRQPQSLDSRLEVAGWLSPPRPSSSSSAYGAPDQRRPRIGLQSLLVLPGSGPSAYQARSLEGGLPVHRPGGTPPSLTPLRGAREVTETSPAPEEGTPKAGETIPGPRVDEKMLPKSVVQLIPRETEERHKILPRETRSRPSSPAAPLLFHEAASPHRRTSDPFGVAPRFNLARSVFSMGASHDSDDDSGTNSSLIAIDNKIEQAMDLVKSHLMFAVREEVEVLREQIKELSERNAALEQENSLLRSLAGVEPGGHFQAQRHESKLPSGGSA